MINFFSILLWILLFAFMALQFYFITISWIGWLFLPGFIIFDLFFFGITAWVTFGMSEPRREVS